jgi:hypothetical protein
VEGSEDSYAVASVGAGSTTACTWGAGVSLTIFGVSTAAFLTFGFGAVFLPSQLRPKLEKAHTDEEEVITRLPIFRLRFCTA